MRVLSVLVSSALFLGCSSKEEKVLLDALQSKIEYHKKLQKTEKIQLYNENRETVLLISATYLRKSKDEKSDEVFVVGLYSENDPPKPELMLNNMKPKNIRKLEKKSEYLKNLSFVSEWNRFYLLSFPHVESRELTLRLHDKKYGKGEMHFAKVAKYLLEKGKAF